MKEAEIEGAYEVSFPDFGLCSDLEAALVTSGDLGGQRHIDKDNPGGPRGAPAKFGVNRSSGLGGVQLNTYIRPSLLYV